MVLWLILVGMLTAGMCGRAYLLDALDNQSYSHLSPIFKTQSRTQVQCLVTEQFEFELRGDGTKNRMYVSKSWFFDFFLTFD